MNKRVKKLIALLMLCVMAITSVPLDVFATGTIAGGSAGSGGSGGNPVDSLFAWTPSITVTPVYNLNYAIPYADDASFITKYIEGGTNLGSSYGLIMEALYERTKTVDTLLTRKNWQQSTTFVQVQPAGVNNAPREQIAYKSDNGFFYKLFPVLDDAKPMSRVKDYTIASTVYGKRDAPSSAPSATEFKDAAFSFYAKCFQVQAKYMKSHPSNVYYKSFFYSSNEMPFSMNNMVRAAYLGQTVEGIGVAAEVNLMTKYIVYHMTKQDAGASLGSAFTDALSDSSGTKYKELYTKVSAFDTLDEYGKSIKMNKYLEQYAEMFPDPSMSPQPVYSALGLALTGNVMFAMFSEMGKQRVGDMTMASTGIVKSASIPNVLGIIPADLNKGYVKGSPKHVLVFNCTIVGEMRKSGGQPTETDLFTLPGFLAQSYGHSAGPEFDKLVYAAYRLDSGNTSFQKTDANALSIAKGLFENGYSGNGSLAGGAYMSNGGEINPYIGNSYIKTNAVSHDTGKSFAHLLNPSIGNPSMFSMSGLPKAEFDAVKNANKGAWNNLPANLKDDMGTGVGYTLYGGSYESTSTKSGVEFMHIARPSKRVIPLIAPNPIPQTQTFDVALTITPQSGYNSAFEKTMTTTKFEEVLSTKVTGPLTLKNIVFTGAEHKPVDVLPDTARPDLLANVKEITPKTKYEIFSTTGGSKYGAYESKKETVTLNFTVTVEVNPGDSKIEFFFTPQINFDSSKLKFVNVSANYENEDVNVVSQPVAYTWVKVNYTVIPEFKYVSNPIDNLKSTKTLNEYVEIKNGAPYTGEKFEAMAGVPTTEPMYVQFGGTEFITAFRGLVKVGSMSRTISTEWTGYYHTTTAKCVNKPCPGHANPAPATGTWKHTNVDCDGDMGEGSHVAENQVHPLHITIICSITHNAQPYLYADIEELSSYRMTNATLNSPPGLFTEDEQSLDPNLGTYANFTEENYSSGNGRIYFYNKLAGDAESAYWGDTRQTLTVGSICSSAYYLKTACQDAGNKWTSDQWAPILGEQKSKVISDYYIAETSEGYQTGQWHVQESTAHPSIEQVPGTGTSTSNIDFRLVVSSGYKNSQTTMYTYDTTKIIKPQERLDQFWKSSPFPNAGKNEWLPEHMTRSGYNGKYDKPSSKMINGNITEGGTFQITSTAPEIITKRQPNSLQIAGRKTFTKDFANSRLRANMSIINSTTAPYDREWSSSDAVEPVLNGHQYTGETFMLWNRDIWYGAKDQVRVDYSEGTDTRKLIPPYRKDTLRVNDIVIHNPTSVRYANVITNDKDTTDFRVDPPPATIMDVPQTKKEYKLRDGHTNFFSEPTSDLKVVSSEIEHDYRDMITLPDGTIAAHIDNSPERTHTMPPEVKDFNYTGGMQSFTATRSGVHTLEAWGAEGSLSDNAGLVAQKGGYSKGDIYLNIGETIYIGVGGAGTFSFTPKEYYFQGYGGYPHEVTNFWSTNPNANYSEYCSKHDTDYGATKTTITRGGTGIAQSGGFNGGGSSPATSHQAGSGGGATHIAKVNGLLSALFGNKDSVLIVAGGAGGNGDTVGGVGGGLIGGDSPQLSGYAGYAKGGTQTAGGAAASSSGLPYIGTFGQGGAPAYSCSGGAGGGWYGGSAAYPVGGSGGSSYIGGVTNSSTQSGVRSGHGMVRINIPGLVTIIPATNCKVTNTIKIVNSSPHQLSGEESQTRGLSYSSVRQNDVNRLVESTQIYHTTDPNANKNGWSAPMTGNYLLEAGSGAQEYILPIYLTKGEKVISQKGTSGGVSIKVTVPTQSKTFETNSTGVVMSNSFSPYRTKTGGWTNAMFGIRTTTYSVSLGVKADKHNPMPDPECWEEIDTGLPAEVIIPGVPNIDAGDIHINIDHEFSIYYPSTGDFAQAPNLLGIPETTSIRGKGYTNGMDVDRWIRNKYITLPVNAIDEHNVMHVAWVPFDVLDIRDDGNYFYEFYAVLDNHEQHQAEVTWHTIASNAPEVEMVYNTEYIENKTRNESDKAAKPASLKVTNIDVVGWLGALKLRDTGDYRYAQFFKNVSNTGWLVPNLVKRVSAFNTRMYLTDTLDIRQDPIGDATKWGNIRGNQSLLDSSRTAYFPLEASKNNLVPLQQQQLRPGYKMFLDVETIGEYSGNNKDIDSRFQDAILNNRVLIQPKYYALNTSTGASTPIDVYQTDQGTLQKIYDFDYPEYKQNNYFEIFKWISEQARRSYSAEESAVQSQLDSALRRYRWPIEDPKVLGTPNKVESYDLSRSYMGSDTTMGVYKNPDNLLDPIDFLDRHVKFYFNISLPSSAQFVASNQAATKANIDALQSGYNVIILQADIRAVGDVYTLRYNGKPMNTNSLVIGGRRFTVPGDIMDPVIAVMQLDKTAANDVVSQGSH